MAKNEYANTLKVLLRDEQARRDNYLRQLLFDLFAVELRKMGRCSEERTKLILAEVEKDFFDFEERAGQELKDTEEAVAAFDQLDNCLKQLTKGEFIPWEERYIGCIKWSSKK